MELRTTLDKIIGSLRKGPAAGIILILAAGLISYANSFDGPFQADETFFLMSNPFITSGAPLETLRYDQELEKMAVHRYVGMLSFLADYKVHGFDVRGYHMVNLIIHLVSSLLVYCLVFQTFRTPFMAGSGLRDRAGMVAAFAALFFVVHPVQTEAVTYVFGRLASLAGMFFLLSLVMYVKWRLSGRGGDIKRLRRPWLWYAGSVIAAVCAMKTKENTFTLPFVIVLYEFLFFEGRVKPRVVKLAPLLLTLLVIPLTSFLYLNWSLEEATWGNVQVARQWSRHEYLFTQFRVLMTYLRLLLFPVNQNFDYDYPSYGHFMDPSVFLPFLFLLSIFGLGAYLVYRSKTGEKGMRMAAFGIFWFFMTLSVESGMIPLPFLINEYRLYTPSAGFFMAAVAGIFIAVKPWTKAGLRMVVASLGIIVVIFSSVTYARNTLWNDRIMFWADAAAKSPAKPRLHINLGAYYKEAGRYGDAEREWKIAARLGTGDEAGDMIIFMNLGNLYLSQGRSEEALRAFEEAARLDTPDTQMLNDLGFVFMSLKRYDRALKIFEKAAARTGDPASQMAMKMADSLRLQLRQGEPGKAGLP